MQASYLIKILKQVLREKKIAYKDVAERLALSESSVKRIFANQSLSLARIEQICDLAGTDLFQLVQRAEEEKQKLVELSYEQEQLLTQDPMLILIGICIGAEMSFNDIVDRFALEPIVLIKYLTHLDKIGIIELLPDNRYRVRVSKSFRWIPDGPLHKLFANTVAERFFAQTLGDRKNHLYLKWGILTPESARQMIPKIERLTHEYVEIETNERKLAASEKVTSSLLVLFREDWDAASFQSLWEAEQ